MNGRYLAIEIRRTLRNSRTAIFSLAMPGVLFLLLSSLYGGKDAAYGDGTPVAAALMVSMAGFGAMSAAMSTGASVSVERTAGWQRQLRLTPMHPLSYLAGKLVLCMLMAIPPVLLISALGALVQGVTLTAGGWLVATAGLWLGALPFAAIGVAIGLAVPATSLPAVMGLSSMTLGLLGGMWIPAQMAPSWLLAIMKATPSYWLTRLGQSALDHGQAVATAIAVLAVYAVAATLVGARRYVLSARRA